MPDSSGTHTTTNLEAPQSVRPYVILNAAMTLDGKIALADGRQTKLSSAEDFRRVFRLRNCCDAILVGINTVLLDDPKLTVKTEYLEPGETVNNPLRIVLDSRCRTPPGSHVLDDRALTLIAVSEGYERSLPNAEVVVCGRERVDIQQLLTLLTTRGIRRLMVEGGSEVIAAFVRGGWFDELSVFIASKLVGGTQTPTLCGGPGASDEGEIVPLELVKVTALGPGVLVKYRPLGNF